MLLVHDGEPGGSAIWRYYVLADDRELAESFFVDVSRWSPALVDEILVFDGYDWEKDKKMAQAIKSTTFDTLVLKESMKDHILRDISWFFASKAIYDRYGAPWKRGVLFVGPPGNGKTHTLKAVANAINKRCLYVQSFRASDPEDSEGAVRDVFEEARRQTPCILILEDLDSLVTKANRSFFLNQLDGFTENSGILTLATSNHPERLDPAIVKRPSRFDRTYHFDLPGARERTAYLRRWNEALDRDLRLPEEDLDDIAVRTESFSFAYLKEMVLSSAVEWVSTGGRKSAAEIMREVAESLRQEMG